MSDAVPPLGLAPSSPAVAAEAPLRRVWREFRRSNLAMAGLAGFAIVLFVSLFAPLISPQNPYDLAQLDILDSLLPPGSVSYDGMTYWLGTDSQGRDMLSAIMYGLGTSLMVGAASALIALVIGMSVGLTAAYVGGRLDMIVMRIVDLQLSFPAILVALIFVAVLGQGVDRIILALVIVQWAYYARTARSAALVERQKEYIEAASCLALGHTRIVFRHLMPNCLPPLIVIGTVQVAHAITLEATLSFLGIGLPITEPSLGLLIANGFDYLMSGRYWISFFPGIVLLITIVSINLVGDQLRDILNPRLRR
jgi:peptide/nickel transport system permease protein